MLYLALALLSGAPALVYEVVWTREVALLVGGEVEATSIVLAMFFAGLALGARWLGVWVDRARSPLRVYATLEAAAGVLAALALMTLRALSGDAFFVLPRSLLLLLSAAIVLPAALPLGGTLPALLRASEDDVARAARTGGWLVAANTAGAILGVAAAALAVPALGLRVTLFAAASAAIAIGLAAWLAARGEQFPPLPSGRADAPARLPRWPLAAAGFAGVATLAYEVLIARMAAIQIGSSLLAWAITLAVFLLGLALGNGLFAARAAGSRTPARDLGWIECAAALTIAGGAILLAPGAAARTSTDARGALVLLLAGALPPAVFMGGAFPFFLRLTARRLEHLGRAFGSVSAVNTAGGVVGSLLAAFVLLPWLGLAGGVMACATVNAAIACALLASARAGASGARSWLPAAAPVLLLSLAAAPALAPPKAPSGMRVIFVAEGRQATATVVRNAERRDLVVNGEAQASTAGSPRLTEELLALLPLLQHPRPERFLEVGFGSGVTLATAALFDLERIECAEIAASVLAAARYFEPDNHGVGRGQDPRVVIERADGRVFAARHRNEYDIVVANTVHPWSVGATGLYSREYFTRIAASLRRGGIAAQWIPLQRIRGESLSAILRTFFAVFPHGALWWGAENVIALGSDLELPELDRKRWDEMPGPARRALSRAGISHLDELTARRLATAREVREALGEGPELSDHRPLLESIQLREHSTSDTAEVLAVVESVAQRGVHGDPRVGAILLWVQARSARATGDADRADGLERIAEQTGLALARHSRLDRSVGEGRRALAERRFDDARRTLRAVVAERSGDPRAHFGLAVGALEQADLAGARSELEQLVALEPSHAAGWNLLGVTRQRQADQAGAREAFAKALAADPFLPEALANAGLSALDAGDGDGARRLLARLRTLSVSGPSKEEEVLGAAIRP